MGTIISAILVKFDNGYNADVVAASSAEILTGYSTARIFNRAFHVYKKGEQFVATFTVGAKGRRTLHSSATHTGAYPAHFGFRPVTTIKHPTMPLVATKKGFTHMAPVKETPTVEKAYQKPKVQVNPLEGYYIPPEAKMVFNTAHNMSLGKPEKAVKILCMGPSGYGKTTLPKLLAKVTGRRFLRMNCATIRDPEEWFGFREAKDGSTIFIPSQFSESIEEGNLVLVLDEFNRIEPWLHNTLYPLLDDDGCTVVHDRMFAIGPNVVVCATINTGYKYTGTFELDEALSNRFDFTLEVGPMPHNEEVAVLKKQTGLGTEEAGSLVKTANVLRGERISCSTRSTLEIAKMMVSGMLIREALEFSIVRRIPQEESGGGLRKQALDLINTRHGPFSIRAMANDIFGTPGKKASEDAIVVEDSKDKFIIRMTVTPGSIFRYLQFIELVKTLPVADPEGSLLRYSKKLADKLQDGNTISMTLGSGASIPALLSRLNDLGVGATSEMA